MLLGCYGSRGDFNRSKGERTAEYLRTIRF